MSRADVEHPFLLKYSGLTTKTALNNLYLEILEFRNKICIRNKKKRFFGKLIKNSFHHLSYCTTLSWIPISILFLLVLLLTVVNSSNYAVAIIFLLLILNIGIICWDNYLRLNEFENRIDYILGALKKLQKENNWPVEQFPNLYIPNSPSVSLQWTIRNRQLINLPSVLLAKDDLIVMRPGQLSPADAETVLPPPSEDNKHNILVTDEILVCDSSTRNVEITQSELHESVERQPAEDKLYRVIKAPYIVQLNAIANKYIGRPSLYDRARSLLFGKCFHHVVLPVCFILCEIVAVFRWYLLPVLPCRNCSLTDKWMHFFVVETSSVLLSLISLVFPIFWFFSNAIGNVLLLMRYSVLGSVDKNTNCTMKQTSQDVFDLEHTSAAFQKLNPLKKINFWNQFCRSFFNFITSHDIMGRCTNFLHTMASVTVLCCVDKKGVLSWPNPTAEKIFFLKKTNTTKLYESKNSEINGGGRSTVSCSNEDSDIGVDVHNITEDYYQNEKFSRQTTAVEVLDITPRVDSGCAWKIEFDDSRWRCYLPCLKPLGLAILLNTCNRKTHKTYNHFCAHITGHGLWNQHLIPVANRRCLCELARQIGFNECFVENEYSLELQLFAYKNLIDKRTDNKYVQAVFKSRKPKFPFPHAMSVVMSKTSNKNIKGNVNYTKKEQNEEDKRKLSFKYRCDQQMFSQGTADVILDYCVDYWDGYDVRPLTPFIRKKILDFYQRSSLTAYCTAFSYRPVYKHIRTISKSSINSSVYIELLKNIEGRQRRRRWRRGRFYEFDVYNNRIRHFVQTKNNLINNTHSNYCVNDSTVLKEVNENCGDFQDNICNSQECNEDLSSNIDEDQYIEYDYSDDSDNEDDTLDFEDNNYNFNDNRRENKIIEKEISCDEDINKLATVPVDYSQFLDKQIFLGMISMQYQPLLDMVQVIEELEKACIRFVHFSKENELRSRVFSEKMGLESGWNCHISLLPDVDLNQFIENEGYFLTTEHEISSNVETAASSADDEENVPFTFDLSNRAKLPCGIQNIKPHLEQVDNVPLLVSLFTDCTSETTEQMLAIMQEYGQVVCVLGSSANVKNLSLFAQADASISVEPLYAQVCQQIPCSLSNGKTTYEEDKYLSPTELSQLLNSLPCSLILQRKYGYHRFLPLCHLIAESRNIMRLIWNCSQFWLSCITLTSSIQLLAHAFLLPPIFTLEQTLWISSVVIPFLSISLVFDSYDRDIMTKAKGKDWLCSVNWTTISYAFCCYGTKLFCGIFSILLSYVMELKAICSCLINYQVSQSAVPKNNSTFLPEKSCYYLSIPSDLNNNLQLEYLIALNIVQHHMVITLTSHFVALCTSFLHRDSVFWKKIPCFRVSWLCLIIFLISLQSIHFLYIKTYSSAECLLFNISLLSMRSVVFNFLTPCLTYLISEVVKIYEISVNERYQKKVRLEFGTKLGMNSPF